MNCRGLLRCYVFWDLFWGIDFLLNVRFFLFCDGFWEVGVCMGVGIIMFGKGMYLFWGEFENWSCVLDFVKVM